MGGFDWYQLFSDVKHVAVVGKAAHYEVFAAIVSDQVRMAKINVDPATVKRVPQRFSGNVFDELRALKASCFVDEMQDWLTINVEHICINAVVKVDFFT